MATKTIKGENSVINTLESTKPTGVAKSDVQLTQEQLKTAKGIAAAPRKKFKQSVVYASLYPEGFMTTYQGIPIYLVFDGSTIELPEPVINYVEAKLERKAEKEAAKLNKFTVQKTEKLGEYTAE